MPNHTVPDGVCEHAFPYAALIYVTTGSHRVDSQDLARQMRFLARLHPAVRLRTGPATIDTKGSRIDGNRIAQRSDTPFNRRWTKCRHADT
jgi:hypothetical protein